MDIDQLRHVQKQILNHTVVMLCTRYVWFSTVAAIGCANPPFPVGASMSRRGKDLAIRCNGSKETWYLTCDGSSWIGTLGNCSHEVPAHPRSVAHSATVVPHGAYVVRCTVVPHGAYVIRCTVVPHGAYVVMCTVVPHGAYVIRCIVVPHGAYVVRCTVVPHGAYVVRCTVVPHGAYVVMCSCDK